MKITSATIITNKKKTIKTNAWPHEKSVLFVVVFQEKNKQTKKQTTLIIFPSIQSSLSPWQHQAMGELFSGPEIWIGGTFFLRLANLSLYLGVKKQ